MSRSRPLLALTIPLLLLLASCGTTPGGDVQLGSREIGPNGGTVYSADGKAYVVIPPGAISVGKVLEISVVKSDVAPPEEFGESAGVAYRFEPSGTQFNSMVTIHTEYDETSLPASMNPNDLDLVLRSGLTGEWETMIEVVPNPSEQTISGKTSHFSTAAQVFKHDGPTTSQAFVWPMNGGSITQTFAQYEEAYDWSGLPKFDNKHHTGIDIDGDGLPVMAIGEGTVWKIGRHDKPNECTWVNGASADGFGDCTVFGNAVIIRHHGGLFSLYGHLATIDETLAIGQTIYPGDPIGIEGATAADGYVHLHLELRTFDNWINPNRNPDIEGGVGYSVPHPSYGGRGTRFFDPLLYMDELHGTYTPIEPQVVTPTAYGVDTPLRPGPDRGFMGSTFRPAGLQPGEGLRVIAIAKSGKNATLDCTEWYQVRPVNHDPTLTRWVPKEGPDADLYFLTPYRNGVEYSATPTAWVCANDSEGRILPDLDDTDGDTGTDPDLGPSDVEIMSFGASTDGFRVDFAISVGFEGGLTDAACALSISDGRVIDVSRCTHQSFYESVSFSGPGTYTATLDATNGTARDSESVTFQIEPLVCTLQVGCGAASFDLDPNNIDLVGTEGDTVTATVVLENTGDASGDFDVTSPAWASVTPRSGTIAAGSTTQLTITAECSSDAAGTLRISGDAIAEASIERTCEPPPQPLVTLENLDFEDGDDDWAIVDDAYIGADAYPNNGQWYAALGVDPNGYPTNNANGRIVQAFTVPSDATTADLSFYYNLVTDRDHSDNEDDFLVGLTQEPDDPFNGTFFGIGFSAGQRPHTTDGAYQYRSHDLDVTRWQGETVYLVLAGKTDSAFNTILRVDDLDVSFR